MYHDQVTELYRRRIFAAETQRICRDRVDWICEVAKGPRVLDVGCSQGIVSLLLAEQGLEVVGIDSDQAAIEYAQADLENIAADARERVRFVTGDIQEADADLGPFDTVVCGEFFEHFARPERVLDDVLQFLPEQGELVVTVPFGVHPHPDHRTTFTLSAFVELVRGRVRPESLDVSDGYLRFVGSKVSSGGRTGLPSEGELLKLTEQGMVDDERRLFAQLEAGRLRYEDATTALGEERERAERAERQAAQELAARDERLADLERQLLARSEALQAEAANLAGAERELARLRSSRAYRLGHHLAPGESAAKTALMFVPRLAAYCVSGLRLRLRRRLHPPISGPEARETLSSLLDAEGAEAAEAWGRRAVRRGQLSERSLLKLLLLLTKDSDQDLALSYADRVLAADPDDQVVGRMVAVRRGAAGKGRRR